MGLTPGVGGGDTIVIQKLVWEMGLKRGSVQDEHELCGGNINELRDASRRCNLRTYHYHDQFF